MAWWIIIHKVNAENNYSEEFQKAYDFAYKNGITTMDSIDKANMNGYITRAEMAKMITNYAKNILWKTPDTTKSCLFLNSNVSADLVQYMTESCQLWLMWQWITDFRPNDYVTRAEFWTVLSRMLYWTPDWEDVYYSSHLYRLKARWIITNDDPNLQEVRWYVMLMLMRSDNLNEAEYLSCVELYDPVCWEDWKVYSNWCFLNAAGVKPGYNFWVTENNTCEELTNKTIQWKYFLVWFNDVNEINFDEYDSYISLNIADKDIYATFCNSISAPNYSISWNTISVKEQIQTEMACEWKLLMDAEKEFILNGAQIYLQPDYLTINTTKWASYKFQKVREPIETQEITESNIFKTKIVRTWKIADYRNEEYGFQFTLPETWNDCSIAHQQSINKETNKIESESFQLICPREWLKQDANSYIPDWYDRLIDLIVIWPDTDEWTLNSVSDQKLIENNKYKFWFGISDASKDIFNWKVNPSDLECWKYPNCTCLEKQNYQVWDFWDKVPNKYQEIWCLITNIVKDHIEVFDPAN